MAKKVVSKDNVSLKIRNLTKIYPGVLALSKVDLDIKAGQIHGLIGKNGAGKTTLVSLVSGVISPTEGEIFIRDKKFKSLSRVKAKHEGIDIVTQEPQIVSEHTVAEALFYPSYPRNKLGIIDWDVAYVNSDEIIKKTNIKLDVQKKMRDLTLSMQQLLEIIKSFYINNAPVVLLDESSASLSDEDSEILYKIIDQKKEEGKAIVFISHRIDEILRVCDVVTVLRDGKAITTENISDMDTDKISSLIVGKKYVSTFEGIGKKKKYKDKKYGKVFLSVNKLSKVGNFQDISFTVRKGEILGLAGLRGSGRTEILKALVGIDPPDFGEIELLGKNKFYKDPSQAYKDGMVYLPEEREKEGIVDILNVKNNLTLISLKKIAYKIINLININKENKLARKLVNIFNIKVVSIEQQVKYLSGGNKQKVVFGKIFSTSPFVYLLDEPTKGIDISTKAVLLDMIVNNIASSSGIILTSPGLMELMKICDRILILFGGKIIKEVLREDYDEKKLYLYMQGIIK